MPLLGMFAKKSKQGKSSDVRSMTSAESGTESPLESPTTTEYVRPDKSLPSSPNGRSHLHPQDAMRLPHNSIYPTAGMPVASSSKLRLPFGRKKGSAGSTFSNSNDGHDPRTSIGGVSVSDAELLVPRPSFAAYSDPHKGLSTRSLPTNPDYTPPRHQKRPFFNWSKSTNSTPSKPALQNAKPNLSPPLLSPDSSSFNLKSFRHVRPPSPTRSVSSTTSLTPPIPPAARPRGASTASDSSQRISVAAFREAQARRSAAGSPVPSLRSSSPHGMPIRSPSPHGMPMHSSGSNPRGGRPVHAPAPRRSSRYMSDSDESEEEEESDDEYGQDEASLSRKRTVTQRRPGNQMYNPNTRSEMGHGSRDDEDVPTITPRSPRQRASLSTSALAPSPAAQRAVGIADNSRPSRHVREGSTVSNPTAKGDSDDDAPLARLVPPRRPGSAMSNNSNRSNRSNPPKPLIDINSLVGQPPKFSTAAASSSNAGFTPGSTLLSGKIVSKSPPAKFVSPLDHR
ncbi:hypothetical protein BDZ89DRAFT_372645 [Hymenopellis radicata]|nr:hypothetical protein BDZ89DRAFT_372645 [Hymenopellis radicata]